MSKESFSSRIARIISANINKGIDFFENQSGDAVLSEAIREIDGVLEDVRHELGKTLSAKHHYSKKMAALNNEHDRLTEQASMAAKEGRDDLAKAAIKKILSTEAQIPVLEQSIQDCQTEEKELNGHIAALSAKREELEDDYNEFVKKTEVSMVGTSEATGQTVESGIDRSVEKAESVFDRVYAKTLGVDRSSISVGANDAKKLAELQEMEASNRINERLQKIKSEIEG